MKRLLFSALAFVLPPLLVGMAGLVMTLAPHLAMESPRSLAGGPSSASTPFEHLAADPGMPTALLVLGQPATEVSDLLGPFELLSEAGFQVYTVAERSELVGLTGSVAVMPDRTLANAPPAELIVVPAVMNPEDPALLAWLRERADSAQILLSVCEGARLVARAGLMQGRRATTHFFALNGLQQQYPGTRFLPGHRYIEDGPLLSSAGVTAAFDATLHAIAKLVGRARAEAVAQRLSYTWLRESDLHGEESREPATRIRSSDVARLALDAGFDWRRRTLGVLLYPGVDEMQLAAALDTHWRTLRANTLTVSETRRPIRTRSGMTLVATVGFDELNERGIALELLIVPGGATASRSPAEPWPDPLASPAFARWRATHDAEVVSFIGRPAGTAVSHQLQLVARLAGAATAGVVAKQIEQPSWPSWPSRPSRPSHGAGPATRLGEWDSRWLPTELRPLALGSLGCLFWYGLRGRRRESPEKRDTNRRPREPRTRANCFPYGK